MACGLLGQDTRKVGTDHQAGHRRVATKELIDDGDDADVVAAERRNQRADDACTELASEHTNRRVRARPETHADRASFARVGAAPTKARIAAKATPKVPAKTMSKAAARPAANPATRRANKAAPPAPAKSTKPPKVKVKVKAKLVRDSFTMPQSDFDMIAVLKERAINFKRPTKKSELLRAGLQALAGLNSAALRSALNALTPLKPGRPKKGD